MQNLFKIKQTFDVVILIWKGEKRLLSGTSSLE